MLYGELRFLNRDLAFLKQILDSELLMGEAQSSFPLLHGLLGGLYSDVNGFFIVCAKGDFN